jgi:hypothetical protein
MAESAIAKAMAIAARLSQQATGGAGDGGGGGSTYILIRLQLL